MLYCSNSFGKGRFRPFSVIRIAFFPYKLYIRRTGQTMPRGRRQDANTFIIYKISIMGKSSSNKTSLSQLALLMAGIAVGSLTACSDDDEHWEHVYVHNSNYYVSMGVADSGLVRTDLGNLLIVDDSSVGRGQADSGRVCLGGYILGQKDARTYYVRVTRYYPLLTKGYVTLSESDTLATGDDPILVNRAWMGGGYLNVGMGVENNPSAGITHVVNLVYDDTRSTTDTLYFDLRHEANGDTVHTTVTQTMASFRVDDLLDSLPRAEIVLQWRWYDGRGRLTEKSTRWTYTASLPEREEVVTSDGGLNLK